MLCLDPLRALLPASSPLYCFGKLLLNLIVYICDSTWEDGLEVTGAPVCTGAESGKCLRVYGSTVSCSQIDQWGKMEALLCCLKSWQTLKHHESHGSSLQDHWDWDSAWNHILAWVLPLPSLPFPTPFFLSPRSTSLMNHLPGNPCLRVCSGHAVLCLLNILYYICYTSCIHCITYAMPFTWTVLHAIWLLSILYI